MPCPPRGGRALPARTRSATGRTVPRRSPSRRWRCSPAGAGSGRAVPGWSGRAWRIWRSGLRAGLQGRSVGTLESPFESSWGSYKDQCTPRRGGILRRNRRVAAVQNCSTAATPTSAPLSPEGRGGKEPALPMDSSNPARKIHPRTGKGRNTPEGGKGMSGGETFFRLDGRVALVTGGGQGIGAAICTRLAAAGARVAVFDRDAAAAQRVALAVGGHAVAGDVTSEADVETAVEDVRDHIGPVDILVNNAGITGKAGKLWELSKGDWESVLSVNVVGPVLCCKAVINSMR